MEYQEILDGFLLICNEICGTPSYKEFMELYNRAANLQDLVENGLVIEGVQYDFDLTEHIDNTKLVLDNFVKQLLDSDAIVQGHRKITSAFVSIKKHLNHQEEQQKKVTNNLQAQVITPNPIQVQTRSRIQLLNTQSSKNNLEEDLQEEILGATQRMKGFAQNIKHILETDNKVIAKISQKQSANIVKLEKESNKLKDFMKSKSLSCSTLFLMLSTSICFFVFGIIFIRLS